MRFLFGILLYKEVDFFFLEKVKLLPAHPPQGHFGMSLTVSPEPRTLHMKPITIDVSLVVSSEPNSFKSNLSPKIIFSVNSLLPMQSADLYVICSLCYSSMLFRYKSYNSPTHKTRSLKIYLCNFIHKGTYILKGDSTESK